MTSHALRNLLGFGLVAVSVSACGGSAFDSSSGGSGLASGTSGAPVSLTNTVASAAQLQRGDIMQVVVPAGGSERIDLSGLASGTDLTVALVNLSSAGGSVNVGLQLDTAAPLTRTVRAVEVDDAAAAPGLDASVAALATHDASDESPLQAAFDEYLRTVEQDLADAAVAPVSPAQRKAVRTSVQLGSTDTFRVVSSLNSLSQYREVTGVLRCMGDNVLIYVDSEVDGAGADLSRDDVQTLCDRFDRMATDEIAMIGAPSDLDANGRVAVLLTPAVNRLGALGGGIITGFFFAADLQAQSGRNPVSNEGEILYLMVPDSAGRFGARVSRDVAMQNLLPAVFPHELQHAISYNQHVLEGDGAPEASWLNEGISHLMEDLMGVGQENPSRYALFLNQPNLYALTPASSPGLVARGGIFLLLRYLYEQNGGTPTFARDLVQSGLVGVENLEAAAGQSTDFDQMPEFLLRFATTLLLNDTGVSRDTRYQYAERNWDAPAGEFSGVCTQCRAEDGRGTVLSGVRALDLSANTGVSMPSSGVAFYHVSADTPSFVVHADSGGDVGVVVVRTQ